MTTSAYSEILVTGAKVWHAPLGTTVPAASVAAGAAWGTGWVDVGLTLDATGMEYKFDTLQIEVEQAMGVVRIQRIKETLTITSTLAQYNATNLELALAGKKTTTA
jgi:acetyl-CoA carboxylase carboxyltransferase component